MHNGNGGHSAKVEYPLLLLNNSESLGEENLTLNPNEAYDFGFLNWCWSSLLLWQVSWLSEVRE